MRNKPFEGLVRIFNNSSIKKLGRAMRRGKVPPERAFIISQAERAAAKRASVDEKPS